MCACRYVFACVCFIEHLGALPPNAGVEVFLCVCHFACVCVCVFVLAECQPANDRDYISKLY